VVVGGKKSWPCETIKSSPIAKLDKVSIVVMLETSCLRCDMLRDLNLSKTRGGVAGFGSYRSR